MVQFHIANSIYTNIDNLSSKNFDTIRRALTFPNPKYAENIRLSFSNWNVPETLKLYKVNESRLELPRGTIPQLLEMFPGAVELIDETTLAPVTFPGSSIELKDHQQPMVEAFLRKNQGVVIGPCASGKTIVGIEVIRRRKQRTLVLVHNLDLAAQWGTRFKEFCGIDTGLIGNGKLDCSQDVVVGLVQSLARPLPEAFCASFGLILLDECHHQAAATFERVVSQFPSRYRYGLSASKTRRDGLDRLVYATLGPILFELAPEGLSDEIVTPRIVVVRTGLQGLIYDSHNDLLKETCNDDRRNQLIADMAATEGNSGHFVVVLSGRVKHLDAISRKLSNKNIPFAQMTGKDSSDYRDETLQKFSAGEISILLSTYQLFSEGIDVPRSNRLILASSVRSPQLVKQAMGRISRKFPGKADAVVYDLVDGFPLAESQYKTRRSAVYRDHQVADATPGKIYEGTFSHVTK